MAIRPQLSTKNLTLLVRAAMDRFNALTPEQQREHREAQRKSWVISELMLEHPEMSRAEAEALYDKVST